MKTKEKVIHDLVHSGKCIKRISVTVVLIHVNIPRYTVMYAINLYKDRGGAMKRPEYSRNSVRME